jgi:hypothetical protein
MRRYLIWLPAVLSFVGTVAGTSHLCWQIRQQTRRADAFQDALNARIWQRQAKCRIEAAKQTALLRALAADAAAAEHAAALNKQVLEQQ